MMRTQRLWMVTAVLGGMLFGGLNAANAQDPQLEHRATEPIRYQSQQSLGQGVTLARTTSGLTVLVQENHAAPLATVRCYVHNTGSSYEGKYLGMGISHVLEHLVSGGTTTKRSEEEIRELVDSLGGQTNAYTSSDVTAYYIDSPADRADLAIELVADSMQHAVIEDDEYRREMGVVQRELEMGEADRSRMMYQTMKSLIFTEHPMRLPTIGYLSVLQGITRQDAIDFYKDRYVPQNMVFVVVGDVQTQHVLDEVLKNFQDFHRTTERSPVLADEPDQASPREARLQMEGPTVQLSLAWPTVPLQHPDLYPLDVASYLLTNGDSSRLVRRLKIEQPLAISVSSASYTPGDVKGWFQLSVECEPQNMAKCRQVMLEEVIRLTKELASDDELAKVKRQKAAEHVFAQQTVQAQAESLARSYLATGDPLFDEQYVEGIQRVTAEQIRSVARRYFRPQRLNTVTIEPTGTESQEQAEKSDKQIESQVLRKQLSNGLTVLLKRHAVVPMVSIQAFVKGGVLSDTDATAGRAALATDLMDKGTEKYTAEEIATYFDSIGGSLGVGSQRNTSYLQCSVLAEDFEKSMDYVHQVLFKPTFPADEFAKAQQLQLGQIAARQGNPQTEILDFWTRQLPDTSPYSRTILGLPETVGKLTVDDCRKFHSQYFVPSNMVLAIYGDIDPDKTLAMLEKSFGKVPAAPKFSFPTYEDQHQAEQTTKRHLQNQRENTAMIVMGYPTVSVHDHKTRAALQVLGGVLTGGGGAGGRLFTELRGERLVYYVFGFEMTGLAPGYYVFLAQTRPETSQEVIQRIEANLEKIRKEGIPADEFQKVQDKLIASHAISNTTPGEQAFEAAVNELYGLGYDYDKSYDERIRNVTVEDVQRVLNEYFQHPTIATSSTETE